MDYKGAGSHQLDHVSATTGQAEGVLPRNRRIRIVLAIVLLICLLTIVVDSFTNKRVEIASLAFLQWVEIHPFQGVLSVIVVYTLATVLFVPGSILTLGTGFAFGAAFDSTAKGVALASAAVFVGASLGSILSFLLGRYLFRDCVLHLAHSYPIFQAVDSALQHNGIKIMILLRLSPLIPYNALDYMSGVTAIPLWSYTLASVALLPGIFLFTCIGATASSLTESGSSSAGNKTARVVSLVFGVTFAIVGVSVAAYYSKLELNKILATEQERSNSLLVADQDEGSSKDNEDDESEISLSQTSYYYQNAS